MGWDGMGWDARRVAWALVSSAPCFRPALVSLSLPSPPRSRIRIELIDRQVHTLASRVKKLVARVAVISGIEVILVQSCIRCCHRA